MMMMNGDDDDDSRYSTNILVEQMKSMVCVQFPIHTGSVWDMYLLYYTYWNDDDDDEFSKQITARCLLLLVIVFICVTLTCRLVYDLALCVFLHIFKFVFIQNMFSYFTIPYNV